MVKRTVLCVFVIGLLCACAPRAREYSAVVTGAPDSTDAATGAGEAAFVPEVILRDPPARFAVPEGWAVASDADLYTLSRPGLDAAIEFVATERIHPDYTYREELKALKASAQRLYSGVETTYENRYHVLGDYSGIELIYTYAPAGKAGRMTSHTVIFFEDGKEYDFALTAGEKAYPQAEQAFKDLLFSLELG
jgi:hypothetical protein